jgi:predicted nucleic acid-binding protein
VSLEFATPDHHAGARRWLSKLHDQAITYTDAVSFAVAQTTACDAVISFDADFVVAGFVLWRHA